MQNNTSFEIHEICQQNDILISSNCGIIYKYTKVEPVTQADCGGVKVSTGVWNQEKRAVVCQVYVKNGTLNINAKNNNNYALAA